MKRLNKHTGIRTAGMLVLLGILCASGMNCKSPSSPDEEKNAQVLVSNACGAAVDIFFNDVFKTTLENNSDTTIEIGTEGTYQLDANKTATSIKVSEGEVAVVLGGVYNWNIWGPSKIIVTNNYGETLEIHVDGTFLGELDTSYSEQILNVTFGEHTVEAKISSTGVVIVSITFEVNDVRDYFWEITKED